MSERHGQQALTAAELEQRIEQRRRELTALTRTLAEAYRPATLATRAANRAIDRSVDEAARLAGHAMQRARDWADDTGREAAQVHVAKAMSEASNDPASAQRSETFNHIEASAQGLAAKLKAESSETVDRILAELKHRARDGAPRIRKTARVADEAASDYAVPAAAALAIAAIATYALSSNRD